MRGRGDGLAVPPPPGITQIYDETEGDSMATVLDGKAVSERRLELLRETIDESGLHPRLATVLVGDDPGSALYVRMKHQACERVHIGSINVALPGDATTARVAETVRRLNEDPEINGILRPAPAPCRDRSGGRDRCRLASQGCRWLSSLQPRPALLRPSPFLSLHTGRDHDPVRGGTASTREAGARSWSAGRSTWGGPWPRSC